MCEYEKGFPTRYKGEDSMASGKKLFKAWNKDLMAYIVAQNCDEVYVVFKRIFYNDNLGSKSNLPTTVEELGDWCGNFCRFEVPSLQVDEAK